MQRGEGELRGHVLEWVGGAGIRAPAGLRCGSPTVTGGKAENGYRHR